MEFGGWRLARPPGIEPGLRVPETLVMSFSLRAPVFFLPDRGPPAQAAPCAPRSEGPGERSTLHYGESGRRTAVRRAPTELRFGKQTVVKGCAAFQQHFTSGFW